MAKVKKTTKAEGWQRLDPKDSKFAPIMAEVDKAASELKSERVNARFAARDVALLKERAEREGMPYQTLMGSVLHKFVTGKLVDVDDVPKIAKLLKK